MAELSSESPSIRPPVVAVALTVAAGYVDAFGFLTLSGVYTSNMSGNTVLIGAHGFGKEGPVAIHAFTIAMFVLGLIVSGIVVEFGARRDVRRTLALAMALEIVLLVALLAYGWGIIDRTDGAAEGWALYGLIALAALAMGIQNTSLRTAGILTAYTTHVTGTITKFGEYTVEWLFARRGSQWKDGDAAASGRSAIFSAALWLGFLGGATLAAVLHPDVQALGLAIPLAIVSAVAVTDLVAPLAEPAPGGSG